MMNYTHFNELWEKNLENVNAFAGVMKDETTKAMQRQANVVTDGITMGVNLSNTMVEELNKNVMNASQVWGDIFSRALNTEASTPATKTKATKE